MGSDKISALSMGAVFSRIKTNGKFILELGLGNREYMKDTEIRIRVLEVVLDFGDRVGVWRGVRILRSLGVGEGLGSGGR